MVASSSIIGAAFAVAINYSVATIICRQRDIEFTKKKRNIDYAVTFIAAAVLGFIYIPKGITVEMLLQYILICAMSVFALTDAACHFISNKLLLALIMLWTGIVGIIVIYMPQNGLELMFRSLIGAIVGGAIFLLCYFLSRGQLGAGDVKLVFVMGLYLTGDRIIGAVFYGVIACCIYSVIQLVRRKMGIKDGVPLAPFLYAGQLLTYFILA